MRGIEAQFLALQKGFNEIIPQHLLKPFDERELEVIRKKLKWMFHRVHCFFHKICLCRIFKGKQFRMLCQY